jgi:hypothetical protein
VTLILKTTSTVIWDDFVLVGAEAISNCFNNMSMIKLASGALLALSALSSGAEAAAVFFGNVKCPAGNAAPAKPSDLNSPFVQTAPTNVCFQVILRSQYITCTDHL